MTAPKDGHRVLRGRRRGVWCTGVFAVIALVVFAVALFTARGVSLPIGLENLHALRQQRIFEKDIWEVQWSPDGRRVAWVRWESPIEIRDASTLELRERIGENKKIIHFAFSPDRDVIAFCENTTEVEIHNSRTGASLRLQTRNSQPRMIFNPTGDLLATGGSGKEAHLWRVRSGRLQASLDMGEDQGGLTPVFNRRGDMLAVGNRNSHTCLFDVRTGALIRTLPRRMTHGLAFHPDDTLLAASMLPGPGGTALHTPGGHLDSVLSSGGLKPATLPDEPYTAGSEPRCALHTAST